METLADVLGANPTTCGHKEPRQCYAITYVVPSEWEDWAWCQQTITKDNLKATSVKLCSDCQKKTPSKRREVHRGKISSLENSIDTAREGIEKIEECSTPVWCENCDTYHEEEDLIQVRECPHCEIFFNGTDNGRNCEDCNRPFTSKTHDRGCPEEPTEDELPPAEENIDKRIEEIQAGMVKAQEQLTWLAGVNPLSHYTDSDCDVDESTELCRDCGAHHSTPCPLCDGKAFHRFGCSEIGADTKVADLKGG